MSKKVLPLDKEITGEIILKNRCYDKLVELCELGTRFAGTPGEKLAADFIVKELESYGLNPRIESFEHLAWKRGTAKLEILEPIQRDLHTISLAGAPSTAPNGIEDDILFLGNGTPDEFNRFKSDIKGKIVMSTSLSPTNDCIPPRQCHRRTKYGRAIEFGAKGFIFMNSQPGMLPQTGSTRQNRRGEIPAVTVPYEEGEVLRHFLEKGRVKVRLIVQNEDFTNQSGNIVADIPGRYQDEIVIIGGHYDSHDNSPGAGDNGAGVVTILELARIIIQSGAQFEKTIRLVFFGVEEMASVGSSFYVHDHKVDLEKIHLFINIDGQGRPGGRTFDTQGFNDLGDYIHTISSELGYSMKLPEPSFSGDALAFVLGGVPTASIKKTNTPGLFDYRGFEDLEDRGWGHTSGDTLDKVSPFAMVEGAIIAGRLLIRAADHKGRIAKHRTPKEVSKIIEDFGMDEVLHYMQWPSIPIGPKSHGPESY